MEQEPKKTKEKRPPLQEATLRPINRPDRKGVRKVIEDEILTNISYGVFSPFHYAFLLRLETNPKESLADAWDAVNEDFKKKEGKKPDDPGAISNPFKPRPKLSFESKD